MVGAKHSYPPIEKSCLVLIFCREKAKALHIGTPSPTRHKGQHQKVCAKSAYTHRVTWKMGATHHGFRHHIRPTKRGKGHALA
jgi:hypothetical protein